MRLYECEGKEIVKKCGIAVPQGTLVRAGEKARQAAIKIGKEVVIKSQILTGGREKLVE
ncbi:MAG: hypothetical protein JSW24_05420 [Dehalococcoidia bacterium]|nr:MAG: hypothetical protein JSW24_05420 [Dehalococcoidia bacterium]